MIKVTNPTGRAYQERHKVAGHGGKGYRFHEVTVPAHGKPVSFAELDADIVAHMKAAGLVVELPADAGAT